MVIRRRVVTGLDEHGRSVVVQNGPSPGRFESGEWEELWAFAHIPASMADSCDPAAVSSFRLTPQDGQIACRLFTITAVDTPGRETQNREWDERLDHAETEAPESDGSPWMHRTPTIDIIVVISGEMDLVLDSGEEVHLRPGDSVIQRGTMHGWRATTPFCLAVAFMARAE